MTITDPITQALDYVHDPADPPDPAALHTELDGLRARRARALAVEGDLIDALDERIAALEAEIATQQEARTLVAGYPRIDLRVPLSWRHDAPATANHRMPVLAVYRLDSPTMTIRAGRPWTHTAEAEMVAVGGAMVGVLGTVIAAVDALLGGVVWLTPALVLAATIAWVVGWAACHTAYGRSVYGLFPRLPAVLADCYDDVLARMRHPFEDRTRTTRFAGAIPDDIKDRIGEAADVFGRDNLFIVAEATDWHGEDRRLRSVDPLIVGVRGRATFLVGSFDLTPVERAVAGEWTVSERDDGAR